MADVYIAPMTRPLLTPAFVVVIAAAIAAQAPEPPISDTRLTVNTLVREDVFAGFLQNDLARLTRAEKNIELLLASRPADRASLLAWQGSTALTRAVVANESRQPDEFQQQYRRALDLFAEAMRLGPGSVGVFAITAVRRSRWPIGCLRWNGRQLGSSPTRRTSSFGSCRERQSKSCHSITKVRCSRASRKARSGTGRNEEFSAQID